MEYCDLILIGMFSIFKFLETFIGVDCNMGKLGLEKDGFVL